MPFLLFTEENISSTITALMQPKFVWLGFVALLAIFMIITVILFYHWMSYGYAPVKTRFMSILYLAGSSVLLAVIFTSLTLYTNSL